MFILLQCKMHQAESCLFAVNGGWFGPNWCAAVSIPAHSCWKMSQSRHILACCSTPPLLQTYNRQTETLKVMVMQNLHEWYYIYSILCMRWRWHEGSETIVLECLKSVFSFVKKKKPYVSPTNPSSKSYSWDETAENDWKHCSTSARPCVALWFCSPRLEKKKTQSSSSLMYHHGDGKARR